MFQTYEPVSDRSFAANHLPALRKALKAQNLDGFLVPHDDEYQNEYIPAYAERLMWVSGFSGSAGDAIIMLEQAVIFVDGRYTLQVRDQVDDLFYAYEDSTDMPMHRWLAEHTEASQRIGYDPMLHSVAGLKRLQQAAKKSGCDLVPVLKNPIDEAWHDQPAAPTARITPHDVTFAGKALNEKRDEISSLVAASGADAVLLTAPPSIAWLFNIRGGDVSRSPLPLSRAILHANGAASLFFDPNKGSNSLSDHLGSDIDVRPETAVTESLTKLAKEKKRILIDPAITPSAYATTLEENGATLIHGQDPCALPRARKNTTEIAGTRTAHERDGAAVTRFLHWLDTEAQSGKVDEIGAAQKLETIRAESDLLKDLSFDSISGAGSNGAICHYRVSTQTNLTLAKGSLYLIDSGGQYPDGTTDITRTVPIGTPTQEMRDRFTRVLKGHISLATIKFPRGTTGHQLDVLARRPLWEMGLDYDHGTGHGVGSFLGVHEGPQRIAKAVNNVALEPGMILSNEPGFYKANEFGIRIENLIVVSEPEPIPGGEREMMHFETITLAPINLALIDANLLTQDEIEWLNAYHSRVHKTLLPMIPPDIQDWFEQATKAL